MDDVRLKELLKRADGGEAVGDAAGMMGAVLRRRARRDRARRAGAGVVGLALVGVVVGVWQLGRPAKPEPGVGTVAAVSNRVEADRLAREAAAWLAVAQRAEAVERLDRAEGAAARLRAVVESERERAATVMINQGDWRRKQGQSGAEEYRRAAELFDGTRAAAEARARLGQG